MSLMDSIEKGFGRVNSAVFRRVNQTRDWWELPLPLGLLNLRGFRDDLRQLNLYDTGNGGPHGTTAPEKLPDYRTYDGSLQDPRDPDMGKVGSRFGRNAPPGTTFPEQMPELMDPSPREVSKRLLTRDTFKPATTLNVLAAC